MYVFYSEFVWNTCPLRGLIFSKTRRLFVFRFQAHDWGTGKSFIWDAERAGTVLPGEQKAQMSITHHHVCTYLMGGNKEEGAKLFLVVPTVRRKGNRHEVKQTNKQNPNKLNLNTTKHFFYSKGSQRLA